MKARYRGAKFGLAYYDRPRDGQTLYQWRLKRVLLSAPGAARAVKLVFAQVRVEFDKMVESMKPFLEVLKRSSQFRRQSFALSGPIFGSSVRAAAEREQDEARQSALEGPK